MTTVLNAGLDTYKVATGEIGRCMYAYRLTGAVASYLTPIPVGAEGGSAGGPIGTVLGVAVGLTFAAGEYLYDNRQTFQENGNKFTWGISSTKNWLQHIAIPY